MDMIQKTNSSHPGTPMGVAPVAYTLWQRFLRFDPGDPIWPNRDRFVLSEGHASALLWSLLHLSGVQAVDPQYEVLHRAAVTLDDLQTFRQLDSRCPGHPEYRWTSGVETTTGPLGQGVATSVGMAIAGRWLAERYNRDDMKVFDFDVYALAGDGCMMEDVASEAASLAGHLRLSKLCWIYDSNRVTIEGHTDITFTENVGERFIAYGWTITTVANANDIESIERAFRPFRAEGERPTLVVVHSHIGYGSPVEDSPKAHGAPFGVEAVKATKRFFGLPEDADFYVPDSVYNQFASGIGARGRAARDEWEAMFGRYRAAFLDLADEIEHIQRRDPDGWANALPTFLPDAKGIASRDSSGQVLNSVAQAVPWLVGGSADLSPSTKTRLTFDGAGDFQPGQEWGRNLHFELAIEDLRRAAGLFLGIHERTDGVDGWVSLEISPLLAYDTARTVEAAKALHARAGRPNLFVKIPGTPQGLPAITEANAAGVLVNVPLLFSSDHYLAAADAYLNGVERRVAEGLDPAVGSVALIFMSRWDTAVAKQVPADLEEKLALAVGLDVYRAYRRLMNSDRFQRLESSGVRMQRLLWACTSTKDPAASDTLYVHGLVAPFTVNTMPAATFEAFFDHGEVGNPLPADGGDADALFARFTEAGVDLGDVAAQPQRNGAKSFVGAWHALMDRIEAQTSAVA